MPRLNLKDEGMDDPESMDTMSSSSPPTLRDVGGSETSGGVSPLIQILIAIIILGAGVFALNYFGVLHLWGKKPAVVTDAFPEPDLPQPQDLGTAEPTPSMENPAGGGTPTPTVTPESNQATTPSPTPKPVRQQPVQTPRAQPMAMGNGDFTVQVSAWESQSKADEEVAKLTSAGFPAFVEAGGQWHRVCVGKYGSRDEAMTEREKLQAMLEGRPYVERLK